MHSIEAIEVSPEMVALLGAGGREGVKLPECSAALILTLGTAPSVRIAFDAIHSPSIEAPAGASVLTLIVMRSALDRLFGWCPLADDGAMLHLNAEIRSIAAALTDCSRNDGSRTPYLLAKSIELLCEIVTAVQQGALVPVAPVGTLSQLDSRRLIEARRIIDEHWSEKLTLGQIARRSGLNRTKLAKGFRALYHCSVSEALSEKRLAEARRQLQSTDLPVGIIGYRSGYLNNASFARAFGRRFGVSPSDFRAWGVAA
jgi:AraC family transcriptional activator of pyochelin receptor